MVIGERYGFYGDQFSHVDQLDTEEAIARALFDAGVRDQEACQCLSHGILKEVLGRFRPDLFACDSAGCADG